MALLARRSTREGVGGISDLAHEQPLPSGVKVCGMRVTRPVSAPRVAEQLSIRLSQVLHKRNSFERRPVFRQLHDCHRTGKTFCVAWWKSVVRDRGPLTGLVYRAVARGVSSSLHSAEAFQTVVRGDAEAGDSAASGIARERGVA